MNNLIIFLAGILFASSLPAGENAGFRLMTFNILQGGGNAKNVGFGNELFDGSRIDEIASAIHLAKADVVGVQEDCPPKSNAILKELGEGWHRSGSVYSKYPLRPVGNDLYLNIVDVELPKSRVIRVINCHWWPNKYGPSLAQDKLRANPKTDLEDLGRIVETRGARPGGVRGYKATFGPLLDAIKDEKNLFLVGDFNEPSHLDWTKDFAQEGFDRWVNNPTGTPLRLVVRWPGSVGLEKLGMVDSYRSVHSDEVKKPGNTWTPQYPENTPGRRPFGDQVLDRIDRVYHYGKDVRAITAEVVGEKGFADVVLGARWPSDHRAVVVEYKWRN
tara:strand:- start:799 stop:1791 length:993 start_codon:yes stop_codon:yes gene_type:complete